MLKSLGFVLIGDRCGEIEASPMLRSLRFVLIDDDSNGLSVMVSTTVLAMVQVLSAMVISDRLGS